MLYFVLHLLFERYEWILTWFYCEWESINTEMFSEPLLPKRFLALLNELRFFPLAALSPGPSCRLSNQYIIQDHMAAHYKKLMSAKGMYSL